MTSIQLQLPPEVVDELDLPYEGARGVDAVVVAIDGVNLAASVVTLATLKAQAGKLVAAIRRWRLGRGRGPITMTVKGPSIDLRIELPPNVDTADLLDQSRPLLDR